MTDIKMFEAMICPVCGEYEFVDDTELEKADPLYAGYQGDQCPHCGWKYDFAQTKDPLKKDGANQLCLSDYIAWFNEKIANNPNYDYTEENYKPTPHKCPVCGRYEFEDISSFDICAYCGWTDDAIMEDDPDEWAGCSNELCLNDFKKRYKELVQKNPGYKYEKDGFK